MKVVLDTNVLVAAFATHGLCEAVLELCVDFFMGRMPMPLLLQRPVLTLIRSSLSWHPRDKKTETRVLTSGHDLAIIWPE